jgi:hypothetical protein
VNEKHTSRTSTPAVLSEVVTVLVGTLAPPMTGPVVAGVLPPPPLIEVEVLLSAVVVDRISPMFAQGVFIADARGSLGLAVS